MTAKGYAIGMVARQLPTPSTRRGRRVARKARREVINRAFADARKAQRR